MCALSCAYDSYSCFCCGNHHQHFLNNKPKASLLGASLDYLDWFSALLLLLDLDNVKHLGNASGFGCNGGYAGTSLSSNVQYTRSIILFCLAKNIEDPAVVTVVGAKGNLGRFINNCRLTEKDQESIYDYNYVRVFAAAAAKSVNSTAFFSESNASLARQLAELMQEANQEVPDWLTRYASRASFGGGKKRSGGQTGGNVELSSHASQVVPLGFLVDSQAQELVQNSHSSFLHEIYVGDRPCMCS
ncbi:hypothetical protein YC2023_023401 [Brassica napus]